MKYYKVNGKLKAIPSGTPQDKIDAWVKANNAVFYKEVEDEKPQEEGKTQGDATTGANATSTTPAPNQETDQSQDNQTTDTELTSEDTSSESQEDKEPPGFFEELYTSGQQGLVRGEAVDEAFNIYKQGANISDEDLQAYINAANKINSMPPTEAQKEFEILQKGYGGGVFGTLKALKNKPEFFPQMIVSSAATMFGAGVDSDEVQGSIALGAGAGAATGAAAGLVGGPLAPVSSSAGALTGTATGAMMGLIGASETALTLTDLLNEELGDKDFNKENIRSILEDQDAIDRITSASLARGLTIAAVEGLTMGLSRGLGSTLVKSGKSAFRVGATTTATEMTGAFAGEVAGQAAAGQDIDLGEATLESIGEIGSVTGPITSADKIYQAVKNGPSKYKVNGEKVSRGEVERLVKNPNTKVEELAKIDIEIENDANLKNFVEAKKKDAFNETQVDAKVSDVADRKKLVELEKKRVKAKMDMDKTGIFAVPGAKENLENVEAEISSVIEKYSGVDGRTKDVRARKKEAKTVRDATLEKTIKFAEEQGKVIGKETIIADNNKDAQEVYNRAREEYNAKNPDNQIAEADVSEADGFIVGDTIVINKDVAGRTGQINVGAHELLHGVVAKHMQNLSDGERTKLITDFKNTLTNEQFDYIDKRIKARNALGEGLDIDSTEEWLNIMSDGITKGEISFNEGVFDKIKNFIQEIARKVGIKKEFENGRQVYNFMKDYQASIKKNKLSARAVDLAGEGAAVTDTKFSKVYQEVEAMKEDITSSDPETKRTGVFMAADTLTNEVDRRLPKLEGITLEEREDIVRDYVFDERRGLIGTLNKYNPERNDSIMGYLNSFVPGTKLKLLDARLMEFYEKDPRFGNIIQSMQQEGVTEKVERQTATSGAIVNEVEPKRKGIVLADRLKVKEQVAPLAEQYVKDNDLTGATYKKTPSIATKIVGDLMGFNPLKITKGDKLENSNLNGPEKRSAQSFIIKNSDMLMSMLPEGYSKEGTATGVQKVLLDNFYDKKSKRAKTKAGLPVQQKKTNIGRSDFQEVFGIVDGKPTKGDRNTSSRVLALAKQLDRAMSNQALREALSRSDKGLPIAQALGSGKSPVMFSRSAIELVQGAGANIRAQFELDTKGVDKLLKAYNIDPTYKLKSEKDVDQYIEEVVKNLLPLMPRDFWFGTPDSKGNYGTVFTPSSKVLGGAKGSKELYKGYYEPKMKALRNLPDSSFGKPLDGVKDFSVSSYKSIFKDQPTIKKNIKSGKVKEWNDKVAKVHSEMWKRIHKSIKKDPQNARVIGNYLKMTASDTKHWHKRGAQFVGYSNNPKLRFEYEHAMPATAAYLYLMDAALNGYDFNKAYNAVIDNYKLIALDKAEDKKLTAVGLQRGMPKDWNLVDNIWWERYFNDLVAEIDGGIDPNSIILIDGKTMGQELNVNSDGSPSIMKASVNDVKVKANAAKAKENLVKFSKSGEARGMSTFDFDETLIIGGENFVVATDPVTGDKVEISSEDWPLKGPELAAAGYQFDFSDFANVRGGKEGPLLQKMKNQIKKYGNKNVFVLTARQQASAVPIQQWLKTQGIDIPLRNITGLGKSEGEAKGQWMLQKFAEGYNDMYFVDDALPNVEAVKAVLDNLDIKSKVVQAKVKFSKDGSAEFNKMLERNTGVSRDKIFSEAQAKIRGAKTSSFKFFVPPSAEDFKGLLYNFLGKGRQGDADMAFFKEHLLDPFTKGIRDINFAKQRTSEEFKTLRKENPDIVKKLNKKAANSDYTVNDAMRVYLWDKNGIDIPGLSEQEVSLLSDYVKQDPKIKAFADVLGNISRAKEGYVTPDENWVVGNIASDLFSQSNQVNRAEYLSEWKSNIDVVFSPENINKIEAVYGTDFRDALENMLYRMETGSNRVTGTKDKVVNKFMDWINGSVGAVMFFNTRSAMLQTLSTVNFIDWGDNNIFKASKAFANQPQYWKDFMTLFNSDMLKQRRAGMQIDVNLAELTNTVAKSNVAGKSKAAIRYLLQIGFTPTQIADSFAIASGGSTFYRNKINKYLKEGMSQKEAETRAFENFQEIAEETQQSSRPDLISQQQAGTLGRLVLAWQNTPMQYTRLTKKAISDLVNRRGDWKSHVSRILYYGAMQNVIFGSLQTGLAFLLFGGDEDEEKTKTKTTRVANGALDTLLRGTGVYGAMVSTLKNTIMKYMDEKDKPYGKRELSKVALEAVQLSPPIGSKLRKIMSAIYGHEYNKGVPEQMGADIDNPILNVVGNLVEATTNAPLARAVRKAQNLEEAINGNHETWKRVALIGGWDKWSLDIKDADVEDAKSKVKQQKKDKKKAEDKAKKEEKQKKEEQEKKDKGIKEVRCSATKSNGQRCKIMVETKNKSAKCMYHRSYKEGEASDRDGDGIKEYRCTGTTGSGNRCKNRTENTNKKCYAHQ